MLPTTLSQFDGEASSSGSGEPCPSQRVSVSPGGEVLTPTGRRARDTDAVGGPPTFGGSQAFDSEDEGMRLLQVGQTKLSSKEEQISQHRAHDIQ